jgi:predicted metal-dependent phosphotriesterase family hydrolase
MQLTRRELLCSTGFLACASAAAAPIIRTVLKDVSPDSLSGATLFHEHLSLAPDFMPKWMALARGQAPPAPSPAPPGFFMQDLDLMGEELAAAKKDGVGCIVDGGHPDMGRDLDFLKRLSTRSGMPIVASCGYYTQPFYPPEIASWSEQRIADELIRQAQTQPLGAIGEIGSWDEITETERKVFRAVGKAHVATGLPIFTHTGIPGKSAMEQLDILEAAGVSPQRVAIGHLANLMDPKVEVHKAICKRGAFIGFDRQGGAADARQVPMVVSLIEAGYAHNLLFSSDLSTTGQLKRNGGSGYGKTLTVWAPKLREVGVKEDVLHGILVDNPRRFLAFVPK